LPNATNRTFILKALENAAGVIRGDGTIEVEPVIDRDTAGVPGSPDIVRTILEKIDRSDAFVCDVSIVTAGDTRPIPNPNVLIELGYAIKSLGWERIIMIMNIAFGGPEKLPFDLRTRRCLTYQMTAETENRGPERKKLESLLEGYLRGIFDYPEREFDLEPDRPSRMQLRLLDMINEGKSSFAPEDFYPDLNSLDAVHKFQVQANELIRLNEEGYIRRILAPKDSLQGRLYTSKVQIVEGLTARGHTALKRR
jgi:hypothetical protein